MFRDIFIYLFSNGWSNLPHLYWSNVFREQCKKKSTPCKLPQVKPPADEAKGTPSRKNDASNVYAHANKVNTHANNVHAHANDVKAHHDDSRDEGVDREEYDEATSEYNNGYAVHDYTYDDDANGDGSNDEEYHEDYDYYG